MLYAIIATDVKNSLDKRLQARAKHLNRLEKLKCQGRLIIAGPHPILDDANTASNGFSGSLIVAEFEDLSSAQQWAADDPYQHAGVYAQVTVKPFIHVLP